MGINVLSLFDGMSCGQIALERAGIEVDYYFSSEIDEPAIRVTQKNYPNTIQVGDVQLLKGTDFPHIHLLQGGSPCQGFSFAGKRLNLEDPRSKLFFEFVRLKDELNPNYFLLENVKMEKKFKEIITNYLKTDPPIELNSSLISAQNRPRLYWTNIPNIVPPKDKELSFRDVIDTNEDNYLPWSDKMMRKFSDKEYSFKSVYKIVEMDRKVPCLMTSNSYKTRYGKSKVFRDLTPLECERLQTVPDNYTNAATKNQRYKMLGNGWTVDMIKHIYSYLKEEIDNR